MALRSWCSKTQNIHLKKINTAIVFLYRNRDPDIQDNSYSEKFHLGTTFILVESSPSRLYHKKKIGPERKLITTEVNGLS